MNLNARLRAVGIKTAIACGILITLFCSRQFLQAQTSLANFAYQFSNGGAVTLNLPDLPPPWTAEMWVNRTNATGASAALWNSPAFGLKLEQFGSPNRNVGFTIYGQADDYFNYTAPSNTWTHLAFVGTSSNVTLYANGVAVDTNNVSISMPLTQFGNLNVDYLNATVDEIAVWSNALSAAQIKENYHFPIAPQPGLLLLWHCDEASQHGQPITTAIDSSGNNNNGTIANGTITSLLHVFSTAPIYSQTLTVTPPVGLSNPLSFSNAVKIANSVGEMIINFDGHLTSSPLNTPYELDITNDMTITGTNLTSVLTLTTGTNRHFAIWPPANVTIAGLTLQGGIAEPTDLIAAYGGSISNGGNLTLNDVTLTGNEAIGNSMNGRDADGGAIFNATGATLTLNQCTFNQNSAIALSVARGGAVFNNGMLTANLSSFYNQTVTSSTATAEGGAIYNLSTAVINECTLTANTLAVPVNGVADGGAIASLGNLTINQSTLAGNVLTGPSGGADLDGGSVESKFNFLSQSPILTIFNSILGPDNGVPQDLGQQVTLTGTNLIDGAPAFAPLGNYGGPTLTMPLIVGSHGIDAGDDSALNLFSTDQRGYPRLSGAHVDIGAVESTPPTLNNVSAQIISTNTATGTYSVSFTADCILNSVPSTVSFQYGTPDNGGGSVRISNSISETNVSFTAELGRNYVVYWNATVANIMGQINSPHMQIFLPPFPTDVAGDMNGDGIVSQGELDQVYSNYLATSPYLLITDATGLGQSNVNFTVSNGLVGSYTVQVSTDLVNWVNLGPATPVYNFTDTNAPAAPQRYYRLVYP